MTDTLHPRDVRPEHTEAVLGEPADAATAGANTAVSIVLAAVVGSAHVVSGLSWHYSDVPAGGDISILDDAAVIFHQPLSAKGENGINFPRPKKGRVGKSMTITLAAGGGAVVGHLNILNHWLEKD